MKTPIQTDQISIVTFYRKTDTCNFDHFSFKQIFNWIKHIFLNIQMVCIRVNSWLRTLISILKVRSLWYLYLPYLWIPIQNQFGDINSFYEIAELESLIIIFAAQGLRVLLLALDNHPSGTSVRFHLAKNTNFWSIHPVQKFWKRSYLTLCVIQNFFLWKTLVSE